MWLVILLATCCAPGNGRKRDPGNEVEKSYFDRRVFQFVFFYNFPED